MRDVNGETGHARARPSAGDPELHAAWGGPTWLVVHQPQHGKFGPGGWPRQDREMESAATSSGPVPQGQKWPLCPGEALPSPAHLCEHH